jgi:N-acetylmuramidase
MFEMKDKTPLGEGDFTYAAQQLGCEPAAIKAVARVEGGAKPGEILFESHAFHTQTGGRYDADYPNLSTPTWVHNYGAAGQHQFDRLEAAMKLDREAALKSASWGEFQIMGSNFAEAGYDTVDAFVTDMCESVAYQLDAFVAFCQNTGVDELLRAKNWTGFARSYNGPGQVEMYAARIAAAYQGEKA